MQNVRHYTPSYFRTPTHPITVNLIGCGGTGSNVLRELAKLHMTLWALEHPGLKVTVFDPDIVEDPNIGRQVFYPSDVGQYKANVLVTRVNKAYGLDWEAVPTMFTENTLKPEDHANLTISCVDTVKARESIKKAIAGQKIKKHGRADTNAYYWLDFGNSKNSGQVVLGTINKIKQPKSKHQTADQLTDVLTMFPMMKDSEDLDDSPSCSSAEALRKQDLFINSFLTVFGMELIWSLFKNPYIENQGAFANIGTLRSSPIKIA